MRYTLHVNILLWLHRKSYHWYQSVTIYRNDEIILTIGIHEKKISLKKVG